MATWSEWFRNADAKEIRLRDYLKINLRKDIERLDHSGLPHFEHIEVDGNEDWQNQVKKFFKKYPFVWTRMINKQNPSERYSKIGIDSPEEYFSFVTEQKKDVSQYCFQLFENCPNQFGGNIISKNNQVVIEMAIGSQDLVGKSKGKIFHGELNPHGRLIFNEPTPVGMQEAAVNTIRYIRLNNHEFLQGYFEFIVSDSGKVYFLDYKTELP